MRRECNSLPTLAYPNKQNENEARAEVEKQKEEQHQSERNQRMRQLAEERRLRDMKKKVPPP